jgi:hypothetical protein
MVLDTDLKSGEHRRMRKQISLLVAALSSWVVVVIQVFQPVS